MPARQNGPYDSIARRWLALAERRKAHLIELRESGRWTRYFTKEQLDHELREIILACDRFAGVARLAPPTDAAAADRGGTRVPLSASQNVFTSKSMLDSAIELALSAAAVLQENAAKSAA